MPVTKTEKKLEALKASLVKRAKSLKSIRGSAAFFSFLELYFDNATAEDMALYFEDDLIVMAYRHWQMASKRKRGESLIEVFRPEKKKDGWMCGRCVVMTVTDDMPFVVDSITQAVREFSPGVDFLIHPVIDIERDKQRRITRVSRHGDLGAETAESFVHLQLDILSDDQVSDLSRRLENLFRDLSAVVQDWQPMNLKARSIIDELESTRKGVDTEQLEEAKAFMQWLCDHRFTFLGYCQRSVENRGRRNTYVTDKSTGLGLLRDELPKRDPDGYVAPAAELDKYAQSTRILVISRGNTRSWIHHPEYMDVISIKRYDDNGKVCGLHRFIGLFAMEAYAASPRMIPVLRHKVSKVMEMANFRPNSHAAKNFSQILDTLPRDELFQSSEEDLFEVASGIQHLRDHHRLRLFIRPDRYRRFYACMVYIPRDKYSRDIRHKINNYLCAVLKGESPEVSTEFLRRGLARIYYIIHTPNSTEKDTPPDTASIEQELLCLTRTWREEFHDEIFDCLSEELAFKAWEKLKDNLPTTYTGTVSPQVAVFDAGELMKLLNADGLSLRFVPHPNVENHFTLRVYTYNYSIALSDFMPTLENFGLRVLNQQPYEINCGEDYFEIQALELEWRHDNAGDKLSLCRRFEEAFLRTWSGEVENDGFNRLVLSAGLDWRQVALLRTVCKFLLQTGLPFSRLYMEQLLANHADITVLLFELFVLRFNPETKEEERTRKVKQKLKNLENILDLVSSLDADRVLRAFLGVILASERTNYFQTLDDGRPKPWISLKIASARVTELPEPRPLYETFVYSPNVEGIHLRGGKVARGGLRWSDRQEDFRTEVLGLMKAQMVKNTVIVPLGAKGGFVVKSGPSPSDREAWLANGIDCYKTFIRGLLDITDNLVAGKIVPPQQVVRYDDDDPYLVVAADKGTATFSDIANSVSEEYGHWLGDAFASGGSAGYDHKKMGITARGAWECVKRHFRELGKDIQKEDFTVVGVGDMAGDVFGNGMLLSKHIQLVAAFNHMHIFLDPNPDSAVSFKERQRLFRLPRSSWTDYDTSLISKGGGLFERSAKRIMLSPEVRQRLGITAESLSPNELISAILKSPVELLWNGGIGTYVKAVHESNVEVGDRANDALRVNGKDLRCKVIGEGGNLGLTQAGRIEFAMNGGCINTDAIDNSAGVDSSDREVNIKIPLNVLMTDGKLKRPTRNKLLASMTKDVAGLVLKTNYLQGQAISSMERTAAARLDEHANLIRILERSGLLNRKIEGLPDDDEIKERHHRGQGLFRPELAVLLSYSKLSLYEDMVDSPIPDEDWLICELLEYFPPALRQEFADSLKGHRLGREIIATILTNLVVNRMGAPFTHRLSEEQGVQHSQVVRAFYEAVKIFDADSLWACVEGLDNKIPAALQLRMHERISGLLKHAVSWLMFDRTGSIRDTVERYGEHVAALETQLKTCMAPTYLQEWEQVVERLMDQGVPRPVAERLANTKVMGAALDVAHLVIKSKLPVAEVAPVYFAVGERFHVPWLLGAIVALQVESRWQALARATLRDDAYRLHSILTSRVLACKGKTPEACMQAWEEKNVHQVKFALSRIEELQHSNVADFMGLAVAVRELRKLRILKD